VIEKVEARLLVNVRTDRASREKSSKILAYKAGISRSLALRILKKFRITCVKLTRKPSLTARIKADRLRFYLNY
jgi:hypothetical protein